jgi:hypothetical protein
MRTTAHNHPDKMALKKRPLEARNLQSTFERKILNHSLSISFAEVSGLDWPLTTSTRKIDTTPSPGTSPEQSSFADRFAAIFRQDAHRPSSILQMMIDPIGGSMRVTFIPDAAMAGWVPTN